MRRIVLLTCFVVFWLSLSNAVAGGIDITENDDGTYKFKFLVNINGLPKKNVAVFFLENLESLENPAADKPANNAVMLFTYDEKIIAKSILFSTSQLLTLKNFIFLASSIFCLSLSSFTCS